jgi:hypothetical protein
MWRQNEGFGENGFCIKEADAASFHVFRNYITITKYGIGK